MSERRVFAPYGQAGGGPGARGRNSLIRRNHKTLLGSKATLQVEPGDILSIETPGGGGYGRKR